jgi:hypothetical protein
VAEVKSDRVRFTLGGDSEELVLKVAAGPKTTAVPTPAVAANPLGGTPPAAQPGTLPGNQPDQLLEQRRRAARVAAETAPPAVAPVPGRSTLLPGSTQPAPGQGPAASSDPAWNEVYERMRQRGQPSK